MTESDTNNSWENNCSSDGKDGYFIDGQGDLSSDDLDEKPKDITFEGGNLEDVVPPGQPLLRFLILPLHLMIKWLNIITLSFPPKEDDDSSDLDPG